MMKFMRAPLAAVLFCCAVAQAASFDCEKAGTRVERLVCREASLGELDEHLAASYAQARNDAGPADVDRLTRAQSTWLRTVRNACADAACLQKVYAARIDELDPFADNKLTCQKMRRHAHRVFVPGIDLGSGTGSPIDVDYACPDSLSKLSFMKPLLQLAEDIRAEPGSGACTGTIVHAQWRYYHFGLTQAGLAPRTMPGWSPLKGPADWTTYAQQDETRAAAYFRQWSEQSRSNRARYDTFVHEFDRTAAQLESHYAHHDGMTGAEARSATKVALDEVVQRAAGGAPKSAMHEEFPLLAALRTKTQDVSRIQAAIGALTPSQALTALRVALIDGQSLDVVAALADAVDPAALSEADAPPADDPTGPPRDPESTPEPLLALAVGDLANLAYLLERQVPVDAANGFGKTALFYAIGASDHAAVELLLRHGANASSAYKTAAELRPTDAGCIYPELRHTGRTTLMHAAQNSDVRMLRILLDAGAPLAARDDLGFNALDYAVMGKSSANAAYLGALGLKPAAQQ